MKSNLLRQRSAFTLLELLVVILFLALMASMMIPALARTGPKPKDLQCLNNHRQIAAAMSMYTQDNHELFPPNPDDGTTQPGYIWCAGQAGMGGAEQFAPDLITDSQRMLLAPYTFARGNLLNCPTDPRVGLYDGAALYPTSPLIGKTVRAARTVSLNQAVGTVDPQYAFGTGGHRGVPNLPTNGPWLTGIYGQNDNFNGPLATFGKSGSFRATKPAQVFLMADEDIYSINDGSLATCANLSNPRFIDFPSSAHQRGGTFSFCDGHTELHRWKGSAIILELKGRHAIVSPGDQDDFAWLATHSSARLR